MKLDTLGYNEEMQQAARAAAASTTDDFWTEVAQQLEAADKAEREVIEPRPNVEKK